MADDNYLFLEEPLINRIESEVKGLTYVGGRSSIDQIAAERQVVPAVYIIYLGDNTSQGDKHQGGFKKTQVVTQYWAAVLTTYPADGNKDGTAARKEAGVLMGQIIKAITGWQPVAAVTPFSRTAGRTEAIYIDGFLYCPLIFQTTFIFPKVEEWKP